MTGVLNLQFHLIESLSGVINVFLKTALDFSSTCQNSYKLIHLV